jgi:hypothetical protein
MAVSFFQYNITSKPNTTKTQQAQSKTSTDVSKEAIKARADRYAGLTPRELALLPDGYTITPPAIKEKLSAEELFDLQYKSGTTLVNGSKLLRPVSLAMGKVEIKPTENLGEYTVTILPNKFRPQGQTIERTVSEEELLSTRALASGTIKPSKEKEGWYELSFIDKNGEPHKFIANKKGCLKLMSENMLYL